MDFMTTGINESPVVSMKTGAALTDVRGKAVKFDADGNIVLAAASDAAFGIAILTNDENLPMGADIDIQIRAIGYVKAGAAITSGAELAPDANGALVPVESGNFIAIALQKASAAGEYVQAFITRGSKAATTG